MARPFPNPANVIYNGFVFPSAFKTNVRITPVLTSDGRTIKYRKYALHIESIVVSDDFLPGTPNAIALGFTLQAGAPIDAAMQIVRRRLVVNGKTLKWTNIGIGPDLIVSAAGAATPPDFAGGPVGVYPDVEFGPKVESFNWTSLGDNRAALIAWDVVCTIACEENTSLNLWGEFCWGATFSIDENGLTTRTISGSAETAVLVNADGLHINNTADNLRPLIKFPLLQGFTRTQNWPISADKRRIEFQITDRELPSENPLYPGCVKMDARHRVSLQGVTGKEGGFRLWGNILHGTIEVAPAVNRGVAWLAFLAILNDRMAQAGGFAGPGQPDDQQGICYIGPMELEESIFTRQLSFTVGWTLVARFKNIIVASGLWRPVPGSWSQWVQSMGTDPATGQLIPQSVYGPLGVAGLRHQASDDVIVDFCEPFAPAGTSSYQPTLYSPVYNALQPPCPPPEESSWLKYRYAIRLLRETGTVVHRAIGVGDATNNTTFDASEPDFIPTYSVSAGSSSPIVVQSSGASLMGAELTGWAVRVGRRITAPSLVSIGGNPAVLNEDDVSDNDLIGYVGDCPIYFMQWTRLYHVYTPQGAIQIDGIPARFQDTPADDTP